MNDVKEYFLRTSLQAPHLPRNNDNDSLSRLQKAASEHTLASQKRMLMLVILIFLLLIAVHATEDAQKPRGMVISRIRLSFLQITANLTDAEFKRAFRITGHSFVMLVEKFRHILQAVKSM
eukprot:IDg21156t1